jgi:outer membrane protein
MNGKTTFSAVLFALLLTAFSAPASAQQKIGYVDSDYILSRTPEYTSVQQQLDRTANEWNQELDQQREDIDEMFRDYQARELLYTQEERQRKRQEIVSAEDDLERKRAQYFGPDGEIFSQQEQLMRPIQERILTAIEEVATQEGYDYVFDKSGDFLFLFARDNWDISDKVLEELGIDVTNQGGQQIRQ